MVKKLVKKILAGVAVGMFLCTASILPGNTVAWAAVDDATIEELEQRSFSPDTYVVDDGDLLTDDEEAEIAQYMNDFSRKSGWRLFALTTNNARGMTAEEYADDYVDRNAFEEDGVCYLIDMDNREIHISTTGEAIIFLTDRRIDSILDDSYSYASDANYEQCFLTMIKETQRDYEKGIESGQYCYDRDTGKITPYHAPNRLTLPDVILAFVIGAAAGGVVILVISGKYRLKFGTWKYDYAQNSKVNLRRNESRLVNQFVTHHHIQNNNSSGGNSGRSTTHHSSGGGTHGGGSHKF